MKFSPAALFLLSSTTLTLKAEGSCPKNLNSCQKNCESKNKCHKLSVRKAKKCKEKCTTRCKNKIQQCKKTDAIAAGQDFSCAIVSGGGVKCWGYNPSGNLGDGSLTTTYAGPAVTALISGKATVIRAGRGHTCAVLDSGALECWGFNDFGNLGDGTQTTRTIPVSVVGLGGAKVTDVTLGVFHSCVLLDSGAVKCMGRGLFGSLGNGSNTLKVLIPVDVQGLSGAAIDIDGSYSEGHTCAVISGGGVDCWGYNSHGQLGDGTITNSLTAKPVVGLGGKAVSVSTGHFHTCVLLDSGDVQCMGRNNFGQLGDGSNTNTNAPVTVSGLGAKAVALYCGADHTCVILSGGDMKCFGKNNYGALGDNGLNTHKKTPVSVVGLGGKAISVAAGFHHTCAILSDSSMKCWGYNFNGALGDGTVINKNTPVAVTVV